MRRRQSWPRQIITPGTSAALLATWRAAETREARQQQAGGFAHGQVGRWASSGVRPVPRGNVRDDGPRISGPAVYWFRRNCEELRELLPAGVEVHISPGRATVAGVVGHFPGVLALVSQLRRHWQISDPPAEIVRAGVGGDGRGGWIVSITADSRELDARGTPPAARA